MAGHECYHCKQWVEEGEAHDCWTTTEGALTRELSEDLRDAWERLRETAAEFGEQRIYASHNSIMFSRKACYFFVRPRRAFLEVWVFLGRVVKAPQVRRVEASSRVKKVHLVHVTHRDQVEAPLTDWLREAYEQSDLLSTQARTASRAKPVKAKAQPASKRTAKAQSSTTARTTTKAKAKTKTKAKAKTGARRRA